MKSALWKFKKGAENDHLILDHIIADTTFQIGGNKLLKKEKEKMKMENVVVLTERIRDRIRKEVRDYESLTVVTKTNPQLASLCEDIDSIIDSWGFEQLASMEKELQEK